MRNFLILSLLVHFLIGYYFYSSKKISMSLEVPSDVEVAVVERESVDSSPPSNLENESIVANSFEKISKDHDSEPPVSEPAKAVSVAAKNKEALPAKAATPAAIAVATAPAPAPAPAIQNLSSTDLGIKVKYPRLSRMLSEQGRVLILVNTDSAGRIHRMTVDSSSGFSRLDEAAMEALSTSRTKLDGNSRLKISFLFKLK